MNLQKILRSAVIGLLFLVPIFPLLVANSLFFPFITGKAFYFRIIVELAFTGWVILAFLDARYRPHFTRLTVGVTLFALVTLVADLIGVNPLRSMWSNFERMEGWVTIVHLWAYFMVAAGVFGTGPEGRRWWHRLFTMSLAVATVVAVYGIFQLLGLAAIHQSSNRIDASLGNSEYMAVYMLINAFLAAYMFFVARAKSIANSEILKWVYPILAVVFAALVYPTQTRGAMLAVPLALTVSLVSYILFANGVTWKKLAVAASYLIVQAIAVVLLVKNPASNAWMILIAGSAVVYFLALAWYAYAQNKHTKSKEVVRGRWIGIGVIFLMLAIAGSFYAVRNASFVRNNNVLNRIASISINDTTSQARVYIWPMAIKGFEQRPLFGWGQENFNYIFNANYNSHMWSQEQWFDRAHSVYLDWLIDSGIVGFIIYISLYVLSLVSIWKSSLTTAEKSILTGLIAAYSIHSIFVFDNLASYVMFFTMLGFANSLDTSKSVTWFGKEPVRRDAVEYIVAPIAIVLLVAAVYFVNVRPIEANTRLIAALQGCSGNTTPDPSLFEKALSVNAYVANQEIREQVLSCAANVINSNVPGPVKQNFFTVASQGIASQIAATPKDARIYVLGGSFMNGVGQYEPAEQLLEKAHQLSPQKQGIDFQLASDYMNNGKQDQGLALLKQAYLEDPAYQEAKSAYAIGLIVSGREADAHQIFGTDPSIFGTERVAQTYISLKQYDKAIKIYTDLVAKDPTNVQLRAQLAQSQYAAGMISQAIQTMRGIEKDHPELKDQIESAILQVQKK